MNIINNLVSIGIVNWNSTKHLSICVESIFRQTYKDIEIIIVDNGSKDGFEEWVKEKKINDTDNIKIIYNKVNLGFSKAHNQAIKASSGEFYLSLNTDVILKENFIEEVIKIFKEDERIGSVSGKLLRISPKMFEKLSNENTINENLFEKLISLNKSELECGYIIDSTGHIIQKSRIAYNRGEEELDYGNYKNIEEVFGVTGASAFYRRTMLEDIKIFDEYFDEDFFAYLEDVDLDWRAQLKGWKCIYTPYAIAYHIRGGSSTNSTSKFIQQISFRNRYLMILKNDIFKSIFTHFFYIFFVEADTLHRIFIEKPFLLKSIVGIIILMPKILKKRRLIQKNKIVKIDNIEKWLIEPKNMKKLIRRFIVRSIITFFILYNLIKLI